MDKGQLARGGRSLAGLLLLVAAALIVGRAVYAVAHQPPAIEFVDARCDGSRCSFAVPDRRGVAIAVRIPADQAPVLCVRGGCAAASARFQWGQAELALPELVAGEAIELRGAGLDDPRHARVLFAWPGWRAALARADRGTLLPLRLVLSLFAAALVWVAVLALRGRRG